jgi:hypothetical protein
MNPALPSYDAICSEIRDRWSGRMDGDLMLVFLDAAGEPLLTLDVDEGTRNLDELFLRYLTVLVTDLGLPAVIIGVPRAGGRPIRSDRRLWQELSARLVGAVTRLADLVVVGDDRWWSAAGSTCQTLAAS